MRTGGSHRAISRRIRARADGADCGAASAPPQPTIAARNARAPGCSWHAVIPDVASDDRPQLRAEFREGLVHASPQFGLHLLQLRLHPLRASSAARP